MSDAITCPHRNPSGASAGIKTAEKNRRNHGRRLRRRPFLFGLTIFVSALTALTTPRLDAQNVAEGTALSHTGKLLAVKGRELVIERGEQPLQVMLVEKTIIRHEVPIGFSEITAGMYVGATARKQSDGTFRASRLHVFSDDQRGVGEGHRPLRSAPGSGLTMTNANVETVEDVTVNDVKGRMLTLKYRGGELKILVPTEALVVRRLLGDSSLLTPGRVVSVTAVGAADGSLSASQITLRASVN